MNPNRIRIAATTSDSKFPLPFPTTPTAFSYIYLHASPVCLSVLSDGATVGAGAGGNDWPCHSVGQKGAMCIERNAISTSIVFG